MRAHDGRQADAEVRDSRARAGGVSTLGFDNIPLFSQPLAPPLFSGISSALVRSVWINGSFSPWFLDDVFVVPETQSWLAFTTPTSWLADHGPSVVWGGDFERGRRTIVRREEMGLVAGEVEFSFEEAGNDIYSHAVLGNEHRYGLT